MWIHDFAKDSTASEAESCRRSEVELCEQNESVAARVQGPLKGPLDPLLMSH